MGQWQKNQSYENRRRKDVAGDTLVPVEFVGTAEHLVFVQVFDYEAQSPAFGRHIDVELAASRTDLAAFVDVVDLPAVREVPCRLPGRRDDQAPGLQIAVGVSLIIELGDSELA